MLTRPVLDSGSAHRFLSSFALRMQLLGCYAYYDV